MKRVLFAENDEKFLKSRMQYLEQEGYEVIPAVNVTEARRILERGSVDLAVIDIRLVSDRDEKDISGLTLAKETTSSIPKIILTRFPTYEAVREALGPNLDGLPAAVDFVAKQDGPEALLRAVRKVFRIFSRSFRSTQDEIADQLNEDYERARSEARTHYRACLSISVISAFLILVGVALSLSNRVTVGVVSAAGGVVIGIVNYLLFSRLDRAHHRVDRFHEELLQTKRMENLLAACDKLSSDEKKEAIMMQIIQTTAGNWLGSDSRRLRDTALLPGGSDRGGKEKEDSE